MFKVLGSIERELRALAVEIDHSASKLKTAHPEVELVIRRSPERVVLQAGDVGVSVSWFKSRAGENAGAEVVISEWDGEITFPGTLPSNGRRATQLREQRYQIVPGDGSPWAWASHEPTDLLSSCALAEGCVIAMERRLGPADLRPVDTANPLS